ncbi:unnamed protein product, partial [Prorocentrum cordatum]
MGGGAWRVHGRGGQPASERGAQGGALVQRRPLPGRSAVCPRSCFGAPGLQFSRRRSKKGKAILTNHPPPCSSLLPCSSYM